MNKMIMVACSCCALVFLLASCRPNVLRGQGSPVNATLSVGPFSALDIDISTKANINVLPGSQPSVTLRSYDNIVRHIKATVENGTLKISTDLDETWKIEEKDLVIDVTMPVITGLSLSGSGDANITGNATGSRFKIDISGASDVIADNVNVDSFSVVISGAGDIHINGGMVKYAEYEINGAGDLHAFPLQANETSATISGAGSGTVTAVQKLTANINGAGSIKYKGHPVVVRDVSGVGSISDAN